MAPEVSVVIPTHNRLPYLRQCLDALAAQTFPAERMEVLVVADGCTDGTEAALAEAAYPFPLHVITQPASGSAAARNRGADGAQGQLLIFIDDDVMASPHLVEAHTDHYHKNPSSVGIGPYHIDSSLINSIHSRNLSLWWKEQFSRMSNPSHEPHYQDLLSGNLSIPANIFSDVGGFDSSFSGYGSEDYELGYRLLSNGYAIRLVPEAQARHVQPLSITSSLRKAYSGGKADVLFAELHPTVAQQLRLSRRDIIAHWLVERLPIAGVAAASTGKLLLQFAEANNLHRLFSSIYPLLWQYWYWKGVKDYM